MRPSSPPNQRRLLGWICAGHSLSHFWTLALPPLFPTLAAHFDVTYLKLGLLLAAYSLTFGLFQVPSGYLVDRYGAKPVLIGGLLLNGVALALYGIAPTYTVLLGLTLLAGIGQSVFHPADYAILSAAFSEERAGKPYSLHTFSGFAGGAVAPITVAILYEAFGWQIALAVSGAAGIVLAVLFTLRLQVPTLAAPSSNARPAGRRMSLFFSRALVLMFIFYFFASMTTSGLQAFLPSTLAKLYSAPLDAANAALTVYLSALAVGVLFGGVLADRVSHHARVVGASFTAGMLLMILIVVARPPVWSLFPIFAVGGSLHGIIMPSRDKLVREASPKGAAGRSFGFVSTGISLGGVAAPVTLGLILDARQPELVFWAISGFMLIAVLTAFAQKGKAHQYTRAL